MRKNTLIIILIFVIFIFALAIIYLQKKQSKMLFQKPIPLVKVLTPTKPPRDFLLPDMVVTKPEKIYISRKEGKKIIRFSTTFMNQGRGPLEIIGHFDEEKGLTYAAQYIKERGGPGSYKDFGVFVYHSGHTHWHVEDYVFYQLFPVKNKNQKPISQTDKMSFCIWDEFKQNLNLENIPQNMSYPFTCNRQIQGMSVGWSDSYDANFEGQEMDISNIPDGRYIFRSIVNPDKKIMEADFDNNTSDMIIDIKGDSLKEVNS